MLVCEAAVARCRGAEDGTTLDKLWERGAPPSVAFAVGPRKKAIKEALTRAAAARCRGSWKEDAMQGV